MAHRILVRPLLGLLGLAFAAAMASAGTAGPGLIAELDTGENAILVRSVSVSGMRASDDHPSVTVFGDGRVIVHRPVGTRVPGDHVGRLDDESLRSLATHLAALGLLELEVGAVRARLERSERATPRLLHVSDSELFELELHLAAYRPVGSSADAQPISRTLRWPNLRVDLRHHGDVAEVIAVAEARRILEDLARRVLREVQP